MLAVVNAMLRSSRALLIVALIAVVWAAASAIHVRWMCDDAYIVFRYARNLVEGHGLVFNAGERVEGYTDFLWVIWTAAGLFLRVTPETWTTIWSVAAYLGTVLALFGLHLVLRRQGGGWLPLAALGVALHPDLQIFASGGLETSAFVFLLTLGLVVLSAGELTARRSLAAGGIFALTCLLRADGFLPSAIAGGWVLWRARPRWRSLLLFGGAVALAQGGLLAWRWEYYGELLPNTYYAKSGGLAWWSQGLTYLDFYVEMYGAELLAVPLLAAALIGRRPGELLAERWLATALLFLSVGGAYLLYVVRVGGDFMFARLLLPCAPCLLVTAEIGLGRLAATRPRWSLALGAVILVSPLLAPRPFRGAEIDHGVADEWAFYHPRERWERIDRLGRVLGRFCESLPCTVAVFGAEVRIAYRGRIPTAVEVYGLADKHVAHQPLRERGRPGHEKVASADYLISTRGAHLIIDRTHVLEVDVNGYGFAWPVEFEPGVVMTLVRWDPQMVAAWQSRGARIHDFPTFLDRYLERLPSLPRARLEADYLRFKHFYFDWVADSPREARLQAALAR